MRSTVWLNASSTDLIGGVHPHEHGHAQHDARRGEQPAQQVLADVGPADEPEQDHRRNTVSGDVCDMRPSRSVNGARAALGHADVVRDNQHGRSQALVQIVNQLQDLRAGVRIQVAGGLVGQQDRADKRQRPRDRHALALAAREFVGQMVHAVRRAAPGPAAPARALRSSCAASRAGAAAARRFRAHDSVGSRLKN